MRRDPSALLRIGVVGLRGLPSTYSGIERVCEELYPHLLARGHEITVYVRPDHAALGSEQDPRLECRSVGAMRAASLGTLSHSLLSAVDVLRSRRHDVVHIHALASALTLPAYKVAGIPTVVTVHGLDWKRARWKGAGSILLRLGEAAAVNFADEIIVVSEELRTYFATVHSRKTHLIRNALDFSAQRGFSDPSAFRAFDLRPFEYVVWVGRLVPEKRLGDLVLAYRRLETTMPLAIVGKAEPDETAAIQRLSAGDPRILFLGHRGRAEVRELVRNAAVFVSASELEGFPMALLECVALGTPALASSIAPHRELLVGADELSFFPVGDAAALRNALECILLRRGARLAHAEAVRDNVARAFPLARMVDDTEQVLRRAAAQGDAR